MSLAPSFAEHLLVVDDDPRLRQLLQRYLAREGFHVTVAEDAAAAKVALKHFAVDLVILDIMMPGQDGLSLTRELTGTSALPILLLTAKSAPEERIAGLEAGADDYVVKPFEPRELLLRVRAILKRARQDDDGAGAIVTFGPYRFDIGRRELTRNDEPVRLTLSEATLLQALAASPGEAVSRYQLAERTGMNGTDRAVDTQMARLRRKLDDDPRQPSYILTMRGEGYALRAAMRR